MKNYCRGFKPLFLFAIMAIGVIQIWAQSITDTKYQSIVGGVATTSVTSSTTNYINLSNITCTNLVLSDEIVINSGISSFTATSARYERSLNGCTWTTVCLPFTVYSNTTVQYYTFKGITNGVLNLEKVTKLSSGTPALANVLNGSSLIAEASNVTINVSNPTPTSMSGAYQFIGNLGETMIVGSEPSNNINAAPALYYYINDSQFVQDNGRFNVKPYRAYLFTTATNEGESMLSIDINKNEPTETLFSEASATGINEIVSGNDSNIIGIFDAAGKQQSGLQQGLYIVRFNDGSVKKILIK